MHIISKKTIPKHIRSIILVRTWQATSSCSDSKKYFLIWPATLQPTMTYK